MNRRLFISIELPPEQKFRLNKIIDYLRNDLPQVRWEAKEKLHLTLKFLGNTEIEPEIILILLNKELGGQHSFSLKFSDIAVFLNKTNTIVLEVKESEALRQTFSKVENSLSQLKFNKEKRRFRPHITLGRSKYSVGPLKIKNINLPEIRINRLNLMQSRLTDKGSEYRILGNLNLTQSG
jgi:2'-5' RNA ligase